jgi:hypothetical protein
LVNFADPTFRGSPGPIRILVTLLLLAAPGLLI